MNRFAQYAVVRFGDTDVEGAFACFGSYVLDNCKVDFQLDDVFYLFGFLAPLVGGKDVDVRCIELGGKRHFLIQVFLFFGKAADLLRSDIVFAGNVGYHLFLMGSEAAQESIWLI